MVRLGKLGWARLRRREAIHLRAHLIPLYELIAWVCVVASIFLFDCLHVEVIDLPSLANVDDRRAWHLHLLAFHELVGLLLEPLAFCTVVCKGVLDHASVVVLVSVTHARDIFPLAL